MVLRETSKGPRIDRRPKIELDLQPVVSRDRGNRSNRTRPLNHRSAASRIATLHWCGEVLRAVPKLVPQDLEECDPGEHDLASNGPGWPKPESWQLGKLQDESFGRLQLRSWLSYPVSILGLACVSTS